MNYTSNLNYESYLSANRPLVYEFNSKVTATDIIKKSREITINEKTYNNYFSNYYSVTEEQKNESKIYKQIQSTTSSLLNKPSYNLNYNSMFNMTDNNTFLEVNFLKKHQTRLDNAYFKKSKLSNSNVLITDNSLLPLISTANNFNKVYNDTNPSKFIKSKLISTSTENFDSTQGKLTYNNTQATFDFPNSTFKSDRVISIADKKFTENQVRRCNRTNIFKSSIIQKSSFLKAFSSNKFGNDKETIVSILYGTENDSDMLFLTNLGKKIKNNKNHKSRNFITKTSHSRSRSKSINTINEEENSIVSISKGKNKVQEEVLTNIKEKNLLNAKELLFLSYENYQAFCNLRDVREDDDLESRNNLDEISLNKSKSRFDLASEYEHQDQDQNPNLAQIDPNQSQINNNNENKSKNFDLELYKEVENVSFLNREINKDFETMRIKEKETIPTRTQSISKKPKHTEIIVDYKTKSYFNKTFSGKKYSLELKPIKVEITNFEDYHFYQKSFYLPFELSILFYFINEFNYLLIFSKMFTYHGEKVGFKLEEWQLFEMYELCKEVDRTEKSFKNTPESRITTNEIDLTTLAKSKLTNKSDTIKTPKQDKKINKEDKRMDEILKDTIKFNWIVDSLIYDVTIYLPRICFKFKDKYKKLTKLISLTFISELIVGKFLNWDLHCMRILLDNKKFRDTFLMEASNHNTAFQEDLILDSLYKRLNTENLLDNNYYLFLESKKDENKENNDKHSVSTNSNKEKLNKDVESKKKDKERKVKIDISPEIEQNPHSHHHNHDNNNNNNQKKIIHNHRATNDTANFFKLDELSYLDENNNNIHNNNINNFNKSQNHSISNSIGNGVVIELNKKLKQHDGPVYINKVGAIKGTIIKISHKYNKNFSSSKLLNLHQSMKVHLIKKNWLLLDFFKRLVVYKKLPKELLKKSSMKKRSKLFKRSNCVGINDLTNFTKEKESKQSTFKNNERRQTLRGAFIGFNSNNDKKLDNNKLVLYNHKEYELDLDLCKLDSLTIESVKTLVSSGKIIRESEFGDDKNQNYEIETHGCSTLFISIIKNGKFNEFEIIIDEQKFKPEFLNLLFKTEQKEWKILLNSIYLREVFTNKKFRFSANITANVHTDRDTKNLTIFQKELENDIGKSPKYTSNAFYSQMRRASMKNSKLI